MRRCSHQCGSQGKAAAITTDQSATTCLRPRRLYVLQTLVRLQRRLTAAHARDAEIASGLILCLLPLLM